MIRFFVQIWMGRRARRTPLTGDVLRARATAPRPLPPYRRINGYRG